MSCKIFSCENVAQVRGMCGKHYAQETRGVKPREDFKAQPNKACEVKNCAAVSAVTGSMCDFHYQKKYRGLNPADYSLPEGHGSKRQCWMEKCERPVQSKSLCQNHAKQARTGRIQVPAELGVRVNGPCSFEGCERPYSSNRLCHSHDSQRRSGSELKPLKDGAYTRGEIACRKPRCKSRATAKGLCGPHRASQLRYGLELEEYLEIWSNATKCANPGCRNDKNLVMDHCHASGGFRDLLCSGCNSALGLLKEQQSRMTGLVEYIKRFQ